MAGEVSNENANEIDTIMNVRQCEETLPLRTDIPLPMRSEHSTNSKQRSKRPKFGAKFEPEQRRKVSRFPLPVLVTATLLGLGARKTPLLPLLYRHLTPHLRTPTSAQERTNPSRPLQLNPRSRHPVAEKWKHQRRLPYLFAELAMSPYAVDRSRHKMASYLVDITSDVSVARHVSSPSRQRVSMSSKIDHTANVIITSSITLAAQNARKASRDNVCNWKMQRYGTHRVLLAPYVPHYNPTNDRHATFNLTKIISKPKGFHTAIDMPAFWEGMTK